MFAFPLQARTDCPAEKVAFIQIEGNKVLYMQNGYKWRQLGDLSVSGTKERYSALLAAQMSGRKVMVAYENNLYDCSLTNYSEPAYIVRTYNN